MKKIILSAIAIIALASCNKEEVASSHYDGEVRFTSGIATRASGVTWEAHDQIGVFMSVNGGDAIVGNVQYKTLSTGKSADFESDAPIYYPTNGTTVDFLAYYPYKSSATKVKYAVNVTNQTDLTAIDLMTATKANVAKSNDALVLNFSHKLSNIVINVVAEAGYDATKLEGLKVELVGTKATANYNLSNNAITLTGSAINIILNTSATGTRVEGVAIPQTLSGAKFKFTTTDDIVFLANISTATLEKGKKYTYTATFDAEVTLSGGSLADWTGDTNPSDNDLVAVLLPPAVIGDFYYEDGTYSTNLDDTKTVIGIVYEIDPANPMSGKIVALKQYPSFWSAETDVTGANSQTDGLENMRYIMRFNDRNKYYSFVWVHGLNPSSTDYSSGSKDIWYIPAIEELKILYKIKDILNDKFIIADSEKFHADAHYKSCYWSSTEVSYDKQFTLFFLTGNVIIDSKGSAAYIRPIRAF